ncbi:hypothetical protein CVT26_000330 [Gymnopilus dilepis]|uniref:BTB domain-containing protein n=1 Tax=Gymnopilus dilepis TaxID=231916 RepID=A0A409VHG6_9AGAR|nr:hypothetical protein CVT26_000330 [Gymnopilus dilepis]
MTEKAPAKRISKHFSAQDADITIQSSDGVLFKLNRQNLGMNTGAFPGAEIATQEEIVYLTEPAKVLEIVFQFVYPRRHPTLGDIDFDTLLRVAEAVEKYEVFAAMNICEIRLHNYPEEYTGKVFLHALKHDYKDLVNKTAITFCREHSLDIVKALPSHCVIPWLEYVQTWDRLFDNVIQRIENLKSASDCNFSISERKGGAKNTIKTICPGCRLSLIYYFTKLGRIDDLSTVKVALESPLLLIAKVNRYKSKCDSCTNDTCSVYFSAMKKVLEDGIAGVPPFTHFLKPKGPSRSVAGTPK